MEKLFFYFLLLAMLSTAGCKRSHVETTSASFDMEETIRTTKNSVNCNKSDLPWLRELLTKAEDDKATFKYQGLYWGGTITMFKFKNQVLFYVHFPAHNVACYLLDCDGVPPNLSREEGMLACAMGHEKGKIIYSNR